jgi:hypothetical protein
MQEVADAHGLEFAAALPEVSVGLGLKLTSEVQGLGEGCRLKGEAWRTKGSRV